MSTAIEGGRIVRVNRPRSKYHEREGRVHVVATSLASHGGIFHWRVTVLDKTGDTFTVPLSYLEVFHQDAWVPAHDLDDNPPEPCHD